MNLHTQLKNLVDKRSPGPVALDDIQLRARWLRRKASITNSAILLILIAVLVPGAVNVLHQLALEGDEDRFSMLETIREFAPGGEEGFVTVLPTSSREENHPLQVCHRIVGGGEGLCADGPSSVEESCASGREQSGGLATE